MLWRSAGDKDRVCKAQEPFLSHLAMSTSALHHQQDPVVCGLPKTSAGAASPPVSTGRPLPLPLHLEAVIPKVSEGSNPLLQRWQSATATTRKLCGLGIISVLCMVHSSSLAFCLQRGFTTQHSMQPSNTSFLQLRPLIQKTFLGRGGTRYG